jgi:hypothetical protein
MAKLANDELYMMSDIPEDLAELEEGKSEDLDESYDKIDEMGKLKTHQIRIEHQEFTPRDILQNEKSTELPERRTFFEMSKSFENESSIADQKTRVTINSPSVFSSQLGTEYRDIFRSSR